MRIPTPANGIDYKAAAAALFKVHEEQVTAEMIARVRTVTFPLYHVKKEALINRFTDWTPETVQILDVQSTDWPDCPVCRQSATGRYWNGIHGCTRCGWSKGGNKSKGRGIYE